MPPQTPHLYTLPILQELNPDTFYTPSSDQPVPQPEFEIFRLGYFLPFDFLFFFGLIKKKAVVLFLTLIIVVEQMGALRLNCFLQRRD